jgi:integrase
MIKDKWFKENEEQFLNFLSDRGNRNYTMKIIRELDENGFEDDDLDSKDCAALTVKDPKDLERIQNYLKSKDERLYIFWLIGQNTGLRGGDVVKLTISDLRKAIKLKKMVVVEEKIEHIMTSRIKNNKPVRKKTRREMERTVHLNDELIKILKDFVLGKDPSEFIYPSESESGHYRRDSLGKAYKRA